MAVSRNRYKKAVGVFLCGGVFFSIFLTAFTRLLDRRWPVYIEEWIPLAALLLVSVYYLFENDGSA